MIERTVDKSLLKRATLTDTSCIDFTPAAHHQLDETSKVILHSTGCIKDIGKNLVHWDAIDTGIFLLTKNFFQALDELILWLGVDIDIIDVIRFLTRRGCRFRTCDLSVSCWSDVYTTGALNRVRA